MLILLNDSPKCEGKVTWERDDQRNTIQENTIDFSLVNEKLITRFEDRYEDS